MQYLVDIDDACDTILYMILSNVTKQWHTIQF